MGLANNGPLDDMILVWSKCDFFFSIGSHDGDDRGATASLKIFVEGLLDFIQSWRMMKGKYSFLRDCYRLWECQGPRMI